MPPDPFFSGPGLDRADALRGDPAALEGLASHPDARQLKWHDALPALEEMGRLVWSDPEAPELFLGLEAGAPRFTAIEDVQAHAYAAFPLLAAIEPSEAPLLAAALSLSRWHGKHRFCANCGQLSEVVRGGWSRRCPSCGAEHFPRVDPVVIMLAEHEGRLLLGRQPQYPAGRYSALAGFVEVGETVEAAVARELQEEAGIRVGNVRYIASQPWPFPSSLMIGCMAQADDDVLTIDRTELDDARWFTRTDVEAALAEVPDPAFKPPPKAAIARTLLEHWLTA
ncbi:MAG: NAD(+) diphosphatase [Sphingomicrobium sp.]